MTECPKSTKIPVPHVSPQVSAPCTECTQDTGDPCTCTAYCGSILCDHYHTHWLTLALEDGMGGTFSQW